MIIIVSAYHDPHADAVSEQLRDLNKSFLRVDLGAAFNDFDIFFNAGSFNSSLRFSSRHGLGDFDLDSVHSILWRRTSSSFDWQNDPDSVETYLLLRDAFLSLPESFFPLGSPYRLQRAENKIIQIQTAFKSGFFIPDIFFSNNLSLIAKNIEIQGDYVSKSLNQISFKQSDEEVWFVPKPWKGEQIIEAISNFDFGACIFQKRIFRSFDVRVTMLPKAIFAAKIDLSNMPADKVDWRPDTFQYPHEIIEIPSEIQEKCRRYLEEMQLKWGAFDFIVDSDNQWWFLECNPNGQWLWVSHLTNVNIAEEFAKELIK